MKKYRDGSLKNLKDLKNKFREFELKFPHRHAQFVNTENCTGNYIQQGKNCNECFHAHDAEDCKYGEHVWRDSKNNMDVSTVGRHAELVYESINTAIDAHNDLFCIQCWSGTAGLLYCNGCFSCKDCFGCIGLRKKQYCIMNKQYTKEEYQELVRQIIENMRKTGEWGEFFPVSISEYGYNETVAQEQFPLSERGAKKIGAGWKKEDESNKYQGRNVEVPDKISDVSDNIIKEILKCVDCEKNYRIIAKELDFYKKMDIPIPDNCPDCRHSARMKMRNPNRLYRRACTKCSASIGTSYAPDRPEIVYCESCYLKEIY
jgi:hypothetical protein